MTIDTPRYLAEIDRVWNEISDTLEEQEIDVDAYVIGSVFTIENADKAQVIINRQEPKHELWLASTAGASHFSYDPEKDDWINTADQQSSFWYYLDLALNAIGVPKLFSDKY
ncbi:iron donor protein CyaY [Psittacicella gerlachiana]|uniref:Iron donor protein CyaY n=1 Tax=Psittacicella gerlachiana TaxID=2028574 RepID=A0A3A1YA46_9GAMM|nr:iron donor protein CyaY [Psittacicella gerlachiana]RIY35183.1 iron donor protein CyaY [Psittacicella gerlachiana]